MYVSLFKSLILIRIYLIRVTFVITFYDFLCQWRLRLSNLQQQLCP